MTIIEELLRPKPIKEIWKDIKDYEGKYQVSNLGRVRNKKGKILYQEKHAKGYYRVSLYKNGTEKHFKVHRLVALAFIPNPNNYEQVNHINFNKADNQIFNLEWCDNLQNSYHAVEMRKAFN